MPWCQGVLALSEHKRSHRTTRQGHGAGNTLPSDRLAPRLPSLPGCVRAGSGAWWEQDWAGGAGGKLLATGLGWHSGAQRGVVVLAGPGGARRDSRDTSSSKARSWAVTHTHTHTQLPHGCFRGNKLLISCHPLLGVLCSGAPIINYKLQY